MPLDGSRPLWFRQPSESIEAYESFMVYLTLPMKERSVRKASEIVGKNQGTLNKWSMRWCWTMRVGAYEEHYLLLRLDDMEVARDEMFRDQNSIASTALDIVRIEFQRFLQMLQETESGTSGIKPDALTRLMDTAAKIQRLAVNGRLKAAEQMRDRSEKLSDEQSDELVLLIREVMNTVELTADQQAQMQEVLKARLVGAQEV